MRRSSFPPKLQKFVKSVEKNARSAGVPDEQARVFGAWSACFVRYCTVNDRSWRDPEHVPRFLDYLSAEKGVEGASREKVARSLAFLFENLLNIEVGTPSWHPDHQPEPEPQGQSEPAAQSTASSEAEKVSAKEEGEQSNLLTRLLFHTSLPISEAMELCAGDVDLDAELIYVSDAMGTPKQIVELPEVLYEPLSEHLERLREKHGPRYFDAPLFQARALKGRVDNVDNGEHDNGEDAQPSEQSSDSVPAEEEAERPTTLWG